MRQSITRVLCSLLLVGLALPATAAGQESLFGAPVFVLQPGFVTGNIIDAPEGVDSETDFNFRFVTAIPTTIPRTTLVAIVQWTPFNEAGGFTSNAPGIVYGPVFNLFNTPMLGFDFDVLGAYGPASSEDADESAYTHKLVLEGDLFLKIGSMMMPEGRWQALSLYAMLAYVATGIPDADSPWVLLTGLSLPIAP